MKQKWFGLIVLPGILLILSCCYTPPPILRMTPKTDQTTWLFGKEYSKQIKDGLSIAVAFDRYSYPHFVLDVCISNLDSQSVLIAPEKFYYLPKDSVFSGPRTEIFARDPELQILEVNKRTSREHARYSQSTDLSLLSSFLGLLSDVSSIGKSKTEEEIEEERRLDEEARENEEENEITHKERIYDLNELRDQWEAGALRKTTLNQHFSIRGKVYFPINTKFHWIEIRFPLGDTCFNFIFQQEQIPVESGGC